MRVQHLIVAAALVGCAALPAAAQTGRATGTVIDVNGDAIKGAVVRATNPLAANAEITSTTNDNGRFAMIGLRAGVWSFTAEAPGYVPAEVSVPIRSATLGPPLRFVLQRAPVPIPGALVDDIGEKIAGARRWRTEGRLDRALEAYLELREQNPRLTSLNLVIAGVYRQQAQATADATAKRALMQRALQTYADLLQADAANDRARLELGATQIAAGDVTAGRTTFQEIIAARPGSPAAAEAAAHLREIQE
ncbi:MAG: carboxypeptidase regulatory-like domain-containing protein [Vicinamibacterales bacterium]